MLTSLLYSISFSYQFLKTCYMIYMNVTNVTNNVAYMDLEFRS